MICVVISSHNWIICASVPDGLRHGSHRLVAPENVAREPLPLGVFSDEAKEALVTRVETAERHVLERVEVVEAVVLLQHMQTRIRLKIIIHIQRVSDIEPHTQFVYIYCRSRSACTDWQERRSFIAHRGLDSHEKDQPQTHRLHTTLGRISNLLNIIHSRNDSLSRVMNH